jgi:hypothetical protein
MQIIAITVITDFSNGKHVGSRIQPPEILYSGFDNKEAFKISSLLAEEKGAGKMVISSVKEFSLALQDKNEVLMAESINFPDSRQSWVIWAIL